MNSPDKLLELSSGILERNLSWISSADSKISPVLAINTAMLGVIIALLPTASGWSIVTAIFSSITVILLIGSIICLISATFPRLKGPKGSLIFFGGIAEYEQEVYVNTIMKGITEDILKDYARQCHRNGQIAQTKFHFIKWAMILLYSSIIPFLVDIYLLYNLK
jgi:hypothetical protein